MREPVDLTNCDREPIHIPGLIQPHGFLVACRRDTLAITQVSANIEAAFAPPAAMLGTPLVDWLSEESAALIGEAHRAGFPRERNPIAVTSRRGERYDAIAHDGVTDGISIIEFERATTASVGLDARLRTSVRRLQTATTRIDLARAAAREVRALTGFDRVMVYAFDADWHGHVIAEAKADGLETFLGLHYPASDIPQQARQLYALNWLRIIPDIAYQPAALIPELDPLSGAPLDLSFSVLRSVSPIHVQYLQNMGVTASMSVSLMRHDQLAGLIACHHYSGPRHVPFIVRDTAEYLGQALSWQWTTLEAREAAERQLAIERANAVLVAALATADSLAAGLSHPALLELTGAGGAAIVYEGKIHDVGRVPNHAFVRRIVEFLADPSRDRVFVADALAAHLEDAAAQQEVAAGILAVDISRDLGEYVIWFRPATDRTVDWAGDPRKQAVPGASGIERLSPRGSFALWRELVQGRSLPWQPWQIAAASELRKLLLGRIRLRAAELQHLNEQLSNADRAKDEFIATVSHELRTPLNAITGWVHVLRSPALADAQRLHALDTVERNAKTQAKLIEDLLDVGRMLSGSFELSVEPIRLDQIIDHCVESMRLAAEAKDIRIRCVMDSNSTVLGDQQRLQQVIANLLSNAVKFTPRGGRVDVSAQRQESSVEVVVADNGRGIDPDFLPNVFDRFRQEDLGAARRGGGLGLGLSIVKHIVERHGGVVSAHSAGVGQGATFTMRLPIVVASRRSAADQRQRPPAAAGCPPELDGLRVLVVEDEPDSRELLHAILTECKASIDTAATAAEGLAKIASFKPDVILSDIGLPEQDGFWFIARVRELPDHEGGRTPAIALTAFARPDDRARILLAGFQSFVAKPADPMEVLATIASLASMRP